MYQLVFSVLILLKVRAGHSIEDFDLDIDDIFSSVIGPVFDVKTPHPISHVTRIVKNRELNIRALNARLLKPLALDTPTLNASVLRRASNIRVPMPYLRNLENPELESYKPDLDSESLLINQTKPKLQINLYPQNNLQVDLLLQEPIPTVPEFIENNFELTTQRFNQIHADHQRWMKDEPLNNSRRYLPYRQTKDSRRQNYNTRLNLYINGRLQKILNDDETIYPRALDVGVASLAYGLYLKDREALKRSVALMAQFIYAVQYKFVYAQLLKERYGPKFRFRLGYSFAVLENLRLQFYSGYYVMLNFRHTNITFAFDDEVMYLIKIYERLLRINVAFNDIVAFVQDLDLQLTGAENKRRDSYDIKDVA